MDHTGEPQVDHKGEPRNRQQYCRIPAEVLHDERLKARDILVYGELALWVWQGRFASVGTRMIAERLHLSRRLVIASLEALEAAGYIRTADRRHGQRAGYELTSPVFGQRQGRENVVVSSPRGKRLVSVAKAG